MLHQVFRFICVICVATIAVSATCGSAAEPVDHAAVLAPFLNDDSFVVAYLDVAALSSLGSPAELFQLLPQLPEEAQSELLGVVVAGKTLQGFQNAGGQGVYVVAGLGDVHEKGGPLVVATATSGGHPALIEETLKDVVLSLGDDATRIEVRRRGDVVLVGTKATVERYAALAKSERNDLIESLTRLTGEGAVVAGIFAPGPDFRRVVRELWPTLPPPLTLLKGDLADRWLRLEFASHLPPDVKPRITLYTSDAAAAQTFVDLYRELPAAAEQLGDLGGRREELVHYLKAAIALMPPQVDGSRVTLNISTAGPELEQVRTLLTDALMESSHRKQRINQFKHLGLAMHNYHDVSKHFPAAAAIRDKEGRPLLSWRVAVLPYLEQSKLYNQFHLDEPWDSPHNRTLIERMPDMYADPDPKIRRLAGDGKTTFQLPVGADTIFFDSVGTKYGQITDGTSKTILIVEVEPAQAAVWTQPDDWDVDLQNVRHGVAHAKRKNFVAAYADGSVSVISTDADENILRANLTRAGGEVADRP